MHSKMVHDCDLGGFSYPLAVPMALTFLVVTRLSQAPLIHRLRILNEGCQGGRKGEGEGPCKETKGKAGERELSLKGGEGGG